MISYTLKLFSNSRSEISGMRKENLWFISKYHQYRKLRLEEGKKERKKKQNNKKTNVRLE